MPRRIEGQQNGPFLSGYHAVRSDSLGAIPEKFNK